jgi:SAM-dependent methyltransferase
MDVDSKLSASAAPSPQSKTSFTRLLRRRVRDGIHHRGLAQTFWEMTSAVYRMVMELTPARRKTRYGDLDYDLDHSVDTTRANVNLRTQLMATLAGHPYFATEPWLFEQIMQALPADLCEFTFVDLGSGKGRALLMASDYPFRRILGIEFLSALHHAAKKNIGEYSSERQRCKQIESVCMDARDFEFPSGPLVVYMFNSFPEPVFAEVLENLRRSIEQIPRPVYVAYRYLEFESLLQRCGWLEKVTGTEHWAAYTNRVIAAIGGRPARPFSAAKKPS